MNEPLRPPFQITHEHVLKLDEKPVSTYGADSYTYGTDRPLPELNLIEFDFFAHLWELVDRYPNRRIEVLDGGCGIGRALVQFKKVEESNQNMRMKDLVTE
ncbi:MAG: hypothetical protein US96_C0009G0019 [Candidatus Woesebacteria bacterium GW2011_GWB1_38_5b]|uniref:Uncharacterized protein n=1 Tax=Candidatus Woesebacteria bacterium GW2011_GWB1_38_5b TaxID=1618569 RepID=A0A0G0NEM8_9BACT|nr:MAG: hypothetical protein US96_C0009G0019 [Candidatus Woesebacteria bacterium GW2011_GWB1_38_5b]OGH48186.1 MAG: hypothetical protein A3A51_04135 [Candidatus Levybacteria bacterium RIFCSPLOWO2_01_FULL_39_10]